MRISDWSSDVCSSDLDLADVHAMLPPERQEAGVHFRRHGSGHAARRNFRGPESLVAGLVIQMFDNGEAVPHHCLRSEEHTSELQSLMRISYAVFCLKKKNKRNQ